MKKRILCTILTLALVFSATAMPAFAKLGEIYSFDFEDVTVGQITNKSQLDDYFTISGTDVVKTYVEDSSVIHSQDSSKFILKTAEDTAVANGSHSIDEDILTINKTGTTNAYEVAYGENHLESVLPATDSYTLSLMLKTDFTNKQGIQLAFGGHFEFACTDASSEALKVKYYDGTDWETVKDSSGTERVWSFADYAELKFVVDCTDELTDLYIGDELVVSDVPVRNNHSDFKKIRILSNKSAKGTFCIKGIHAYKTSGSKVMKLDKTDSGTATTQMTYTSLINTCNAKDYTISFDMYPRLTSGSFNLAFGAFFEFVRKSDGVYTINGRQGSASTSLVKDDVAINDYVNVKMKIKNGKGALYIDNECIDDNVEYRTNYSPNELKFILNNGMRGTLSIDNITLTVDSEKDNEPYVSGEYAKNSAGTGYQLNIKAFAPSDSVGNSFRAYVAYYADADQSEFLGATIQDVTPGEITVRGWGSSIPKGAVSANVMLWNDSLAPLCNFATVQLVAPDAE